ncbi:10270_t:CDS:1, partial [Cetraspora pellucida]
TLISSCPNITYLGFSMIKLSAQFLNLIGCLRNLQFLSLYWIVDGSEEEMKTSIMKFAKILPSSLHYLDLYDSSNIYADVFLDHCNAPLKKLLLKIDYKDKKAMDTLIRFCIRKKTLDNVYIHDLFNDVKLNELKNVLKDYVKLVTYYHQIVVDC